MSSCQKQVRELGRAFLFGHRPKATLWLGSRELRGFEGRRSLPLHLTFSEDAVSRLGLALLLSGLATTGAIAGSDLSSCLDPSTTLDAGGDVSDKELTAARQACAHLQQSGLDDKTRIRVDHAASTLSDEQQRRQASHH